MAKGGRQPGAGRPKGSTNVPRFSDYVTDKDRKTFYNFINESYMGDMNLARWYGEHAFAKPPTAVDITTNGKDLPTPILANVLGDNSAQKD